MSAENISLAESQVGEAPELTERRRSTTVIMTMNVTMPAEAEATGVRRNGSMRRRLSKQNATIEEPISLLSISDPPSDGADSAVPCIAEHPEEGKEEAEDKETKDTEDDTKLRPHVQKTSWATAKSLSRESNGTEYSDRAGTDLRSFVFRTMHKSEEDRNNLLEFEKELTKLIMDTSIQSRKFELPSSYHRMLLHRCAAWFGLDHNVCNKKTDIVVNKSDRTKIPDESFSDFIQHDNYAEERFITRQSTAGSRKDLQHMDSFEQTNQFGSQASLNHDLLMMRRAQSFDVAGSPGLQPQQTTRALPMRQLSLNCPPQAVVPAPISSPQGRQWAPQRSFDHSNSSYLCATKYPMMRKAESFGGMANGLAHGCYETSVPMVCQTPPSVMVHHHHHHGHVPQHAAAPYTGYQVFDEMSMPSPNYQPVPEQAMCSPGGTYYEYVPQQYTRPVRYVTDYQQRRPPSANMQYMYGPPQYVQYPQMVHPEVEVYVDPVQTQPFPPVSHFVVPSNDQQQGYASSHQAETANSFIKASIDGGYGSMNQEPDASTTVEKAENGSTAESSQ